jgi:hypothetical protein
MSFTSQPRKYDKGEIAYFGVSFNALNSSPITNESGTWIPASNTLPVLGTRLTAAQRAYLHSTQNPTTGSNIVGIGFGQGTSNYNTANLNVCNMPSTFDNGTPPKVGSTFMLNLLHGVPSSFTTNAVVNNVLTAENIFAGRVLTTVGTNIWPDLGAATALITTNPANTAFCLLTISTSNTFLVYTSTNGITWTNQSISGHVGSDGNSAWATSISQGLYGPTYTNGTRCAMGYHIAMPFYTGYAGNPMIYVNCGARIINTVYNSNTSAMLAYRSTDGFTMGSDDATGILGTTTAGRQFFFHRNGNSCLLICGAAVRFTTDGGINWATSTNAFVPSNYAFMQTNATNRTSLVATQSANTTFQVSTDTGATWTSRTLPALPAVASSALAYAGSTMVFLSAAGTVHRSTDNGANWTTVTNTTLGVAANPINVVHDGYRFYMLYQGGLGALSTSTDGITWTARTVPATTLTDTTSYYNTYSPPSNVTQNVPVTYAAAANSSDVIITTSSGSGVRAIMSNDGGVTWYVAGNVGSTTYALYGANSTCFRDLVYVEPTGSTSSTRGFITGNMFIPEQHVDSLGHRFVGSPLAVTNTTLTNQIAFIKIG